MIVSSKNCCVKIASRSIDQDVLRRDITTNPLLYKFIPDLGFKIKKRKIIFGLENRPSPKINFSLNRPYLYGQYLQNFNSTDIIVITEYFLERLRQERAICTIHSSSIYKKDKAIILFANLTGAGKTSLVLYLHKRYGYQIFSDEKTLVDIEKIKLVGQTSKIFLEKRTKDNLKFFGLDLPEIINIKKASDKKLRLLIIPIIVPLEGAPIIYQYTPNQLKWSLYEEFSKDIRLINGLILNFSYPLQSLDNHQLAIKREYFIKKISQQIPCYYILGDLPNVAQKINQIFLNIDFKS